MRGASGYTSGPGSQGLTMRWKAKQMNLKLRHPREITERKQVGDAESMINEGSSASGHHGFFKGEGGEV
jgi:hypothetical protein